MQGLVVQLREDGSLAAEGVGCSWEVVREEAFAPRPWTLVSADRTGGRQAVFDNYETLDEALDQLASCISERETPPPYSVALPCGASFRRPGRVPVLEVAAGLGWVLTKSLTGYVVADVPGAADSREARRAIRATMPPEVILGEATPVEHAGKTSWCADVTVSHESFLQVSGAGPAVVSTFARHGVEVIDTAFDWTARTPLVPCAAEVIAFVPRPAVKERPAA